MARKRYNRVRSQWLRLLNGGATRTFELDGPKGPGAPLSSPSITYGVELKTWLAHQAQRTHQAPVQGSITGSMRLALVDFNPGLWIGRGDPEVYLLELLGMEQIPLAAYTKENHVVFHTFPPSLESHGRTPSEEVLVQSVAYQDFGIAWKYFPHQCTTVGIVWSKYMYDEMTETGNRVDWILEQVTKLQSLLLHPSLLPLLFLQRDKDLIGEFYLDQRNQVLDAQIHTGYHQYHRYTGKSAVADENLGKLSASVSGVSANLVTCELFLQSLQSLAVSILEQNSSFAKSKTASDEERTRLAVSYIERHTQYFAKECAALQRQAESWQRKATIVIQGIFNLIAQRDQNMSISIARDSKILAEQSQRLANESKALAAASKRDSTSMKSIAAVTMLFLPGTFVASFFATPMFSWDAQTQITTHYLWMYWAVTIPLTIVTILMWMMWDWRSNKQPSGKKIDDAYEMT